MEKFFIRNKSGLVIDIQEEYGIVCKYIPMLPILEPKNIYSKTWIDEDGDDEFIPDVIHYKATEITIKFLYKGTKNTANVKIKEFVNVLNDGFFSFYDEYTKIGRSKCRFVKLNTEGYMYRREFDLVEFSLVIKINDPKTEIILSK